jgi:polysaccharide biosynthesis protein PslG
MPRRGIAVICVTVAALTAGLGAAGASAEPAPLYAPNPFYGVVGTYLPAQADFNRVAAAGGGVMRLQIDWNSIERTPGARNLYVLDVLAGEAAKAGVTLLPDLNGVPRWMSKNRTRPPIRTAAQQQAWSSLLTQLAQRYGTNGTLWAEHPEFPKRPITTWEIWNEPNLGDNVGGKPSPRQFVTLLRLSSAALKAGDPNAKVLSGGLFPYHTAKNTMTLVKYLNAMYRVPGAAAAFDALGVHPYAAKPGQVLKWVQLTRRIMQAHGDGAKPIWVSAFGWVTGGLGFRFSPLRSTLAQQASRLSRAYGLLSANAASLGIVSALWFTYTDIHQKKTKKIPGDFITDRMGLFTLRGKPKPSWPAFARAAGGTP